MELARITNTAHPLFDQAWELYVAAFPEKERHQLAVQSRMLDEPNYHYDIYSHKGQLVGIMLWWELPSYSYLAHFASAEALRNRGFGSKMLQDFVGR